MSDFCVSPALPLFRNFAASLINKQTMRTKQALTLAALLLSTAAVAQEPLQIARQGNFTVGGTTLQREGTYDNSKFVGWATQVETGQSARVNHAFVDYQVPTNARRLPLMFVHGYIKCPPTLAGCH